MLESWWNFLRNENFDNQIIFAWALWLIYVGGTYSGLRHSSFNIEQIYLDCPAITLMGSKDIKMRMGHINRNFFFFFFFAVLSPLLNTAAGRVSIQQLFVKQLESKLKGRVKDDQNCFLGNWVAFVTWDLNSLILWFILTHTYLLVPEFSLEITTLFVHGYIWQSGKAFRYFLRIMLLHV